MSKAGSVGAFVLIGLFVMILISMRVDDEGNVFQRSGRNTYYCELEKIDSVSVGSIVRLGNTGIRIGRVEEVTLVPKDDKFYFRMKLSIKEKVDDLEITIREDSDVTLRMITILQGMYLAVSAGSVNSPELAAGETILAGDSKSFMDSLASIGDALGNIDNGGLGKMLAGDEGFKDFQGVLDRLNKDKGLGDYLIGKEALDHLDGVLAKVDQEAGLGKWLLGDESHGDLQKITAMLKKEKGLGEWLMGKKSVGELQGVTARLDKDAGLGEWLLGEQSIKDLQSVTGDVSGGESALSKLISDKKMGDEIASTFEDISGFANGLTTGEGTISRLINDPSLYVEAKRLISQATEAVEDAREAAPISAFTSILFGAVQ